MNFAKRLARRMGIRFHDCIRKVRRTAPQKEMQNTFQQARNLDGAFEIVPGEYIAEPAFLLDDMVDSGWTFTVTAALLRRAGCSAVFPVALAETSKADQN